MSRYVALGDSYAAGVGAGRLRPGRAYRTDAGYPLEVSRRTGLDLAYQAVLGASTGDVLRDQLGPLGPDTELVSVTVGGNDAHFVPVLLEVVRPAWISDGDRVIDEARALIRDAVPGRVGRVLEAVASRSPDARVVVTGYPRLFNGVDDCSLLTFVSPAEMDRLGEAADLLCEAIFGVARSAGAEVVDVLPTFDGHQICDDQAWIHGLRWTPETSYHPDASGHRVYGAAVLDVLAVDAALEPAAPEPAVVDGDCRGTSLTFELPDLMSGRARRGAAAHGLDPDRVAELARRARGEDGVVADEAAARELQAMHEDVLARRG